MVTNTYKTLAKRIDEFGVSEPVITVEGDNKIRVQLAGVTNAEKARESLSKVANLTFRDVDDNLLMTSDVLRAGNAKVTTDQYGKPAVALSIRDNEAFYRATKQVSSNTDESKRMIVIWLDFEEGVDSYEAEKDTCGSLENSRCLSAAGVSQAFSSDVIIQGDFTEEEVTELVNLINSGSLPTRLEEVSSKTVAASFGAHSLEKTLVAGVVGVVLIILFMIAIYRFAGFISSVALMIYTAAVFATFWIVGGTLTLPGIAAVVIGIGMAVDANVLIFERMREEVKNGRSTRDAADAGFTEAWATIVDSNLTTLVAAIVLFYFGTGPVRGFAVTLAVGIATSMFTSVTVTRLIITAWLNKYKPTKLPI